MRFGTRSLYDKHTRQSAAKRQTQWPLFTPRIRSLVALRLTPKLLTLPNAFRYSSINAVTRPAPVLWFAQMLTQVASKFAQYCLIKATESAAFCQKMMMFAYLSCASVFSQILITERIKTVGTRGLFCWTEGSCFGINSHWYFDLFIASVMS